MISNLIETPDTRELVRDQIAGILKAELANQITLAVGLSKDPEPWDIRVFIERTAPWDGFTNPEETDTDKRPVVNVSFENGNAKPSSSSALRTSFDAIFNVDCISYGVAKETVAGHDPADLAANLRSGEVTRIIRSILMADEYDTLGLGGLVVQYRMVQSITAMDLDLPNTKQSVAAMRIALNVTMEEKNIETVGAAMQIVAVNTEISPQGEVVSSVFNYN